MRSYVSACVGCGKSPCFRCESELVECDSCGTSISDNDNVIYRLPDDDNEYCLDCFKSLIEDLGVVEECSECGAVDVHMYSYGGEKACTECMIEAWGEKI